MKTTEYDTIKNSKKVEKLMENLKTTYHAYCFRLTDADQAEAWRKLQSQLCGEGLKCFETLGGKSFCNSKLSGVEVELETKWLFSNQWNTAPIPGVSASGLRVFDWAKDAPSPNGCPGTIARGHYLEQTQAMRDARHNTLKCRYCGHMELRSAGLVFCPACFGSEYLTEDYLYLTRLMFIDDNDDCQPLTSDELEYLLPRYVDAQTKGKAAWSKKRLAEQRESLQRDYKKGLDVVKTKYNGFTWLLDHDVNIDNCLYYSHTNKFSFGWKSPVSAAVKSALLDILCEFPFDYEIKVVQD